MAVKQVGPVASTDRELIQRKTTLAPSGASAGFWLSLAMSAYSTNGTDTEPLMITGWRSVAQRAFWLNENGSPRGASVNDEPALKLFGPNVNDAYSGLLFQIQKRYGSQIHIFGVHSDGNYRIGANQVVAVNTIVLGASDPVPTPLPAGTVIIRTP